MKLSMEDVMKNNKRNPSPVLNRVILSFLLIGGVAAIVGLFHVAKDTRHPLADVVEKHDGNIFVCGAYA